MHTVSGSENQQTQHPNPRLPGMVWSTAPNDYAPAYINFLWVRGMPAAQRVLSAFVATLPMELRGAESESKVLSWPHRAWHLACHVPQGSEHCLRHSGQWALHQVQKASPVPRGTAGTEKAHPGYVIMYALAIMIHPSVHSLMRLI